MAKWGPGQLSRAVAPEFRLLLKRRRNKKTWHCGPYHKSGGGHRLGEAVDS